MKRSFGLLVALLLALTMSAPVLALAQDATPEPAEAAPPFVTASGLGLSEFDIVVTDTGFDVPSSIPAGRYLINVTNNASDAAAAAFFMPPADWTLEQVQAAFAPPESEDAPPPNLSWLYRAPIAGGAGGPPGGTYQAVIDLQPGRWVVWGDDPDSPIPMTEVQVTGAMPDTLREVIPGVKITATSTGTGYDFAIDGEIVAGQQLVEFYNKTDQPHFVSSLISPVALTDEMFMSVLMGMSGEDATPASDSGLPSMEEIVDNPSYITTISAGTKIWAVMDFQPGFHTLVCFVPDLNSPEGLPHAAEGMIEQVEVA
jgi:hypothetical protein